METSPDLEAFSRSDFDVNSWLRQSLSGVGEEGGDLEKLLERMSVILDKEIEKTKGTLSALSQQVIFQVPRVSREFEQTHNEVNKLQEEITVGFDEAENVQQKTTASMSTLERLDNIKTNLLSTAEALQEADKWTSLGKEVDQFLDAGDVHKSYECIIGMEKSLSVLDQNSSDERKLVLEEVKNRLEALATKHIIQAFEMNDIDNASKFFTMFSKLERTKQFIKYFENSEKIKLTQEWRNHVELLSFKDALTKFYDDIMDHLHAKIQWCKVIFKESSDDFALNVLLGLYVETISSLEPSVQYCLEVESKKQPFLDILIHTNQISVRFVQTLRQFLETSCTTGTKPKPGVIQELMKAVFVPFIPQYAKYAKYSETLVVSKIQEAVKSLLSSSNISNTDATAFLQERIECAKRLLPEIILIVKEGEEKVPMFNHGFGYYHFGRGINAGLEKFREWCYEVFRILEKTSNQSEKQRSLLENALAFGEACGEISKQVIQLDNLMSTNCVKQLTKLSAIRNGEWENYPDTFLDTALLNEITNFLQSKGTLMASTVSHFKKLCNDSTKLILKVTSEPIEVQLKKNFALNDCNLKEAIPSEYITQIGEYLMLLPQNLDPFISSEASALSYAFEQNADESKSPVDYILSNVSISICDAFAERLFKIAFLSEGQAKQLAQDIDYLSSVLDDLGGKLTTDLNDFSKLMKMYPSIQENTQVDKVSAKVLSNVKKMRQAPTSAPQ